MAAAQLQRAVRAVIDRAGADSAGFDGDLLDRFRRHRDEAAFTGLVDRHGPMVLGVCRRVLGDLHAAEDAFQATFLVLAKKADAVRPPGALGAWLHGVAYRTALKARGRAFRRQQVERDYAERANTEIRNTDPGDLRPVLDEQLNALPEKYRLPLVLCGVQGLNKAEAAARLGLPEGTVSSRLARARDMLRDRLTRRGVVVPAALAGVLTPAALNAAVPPALTANLGAAAVGFAGGSAAAISPGILSVTNEVLSAMTLAKWKLLSAVAASVVLAGGTVGVFAARAEDKPKPAGEKPAAVKPVGEKPKPAAPADGEKKPVKPGAPADGEKPKPATPDGTKPKPTAPDGEKKPAKPEGAKPARVAGPVSAVDTAAKTITVTVKGDGGLRDRVVTLTDKTKVTIDGKDGTLAAVPKGAVLAVVSEGKEGDAAVSEVRVTGPNVGGLLTQVGTDSLTLDLGGKTQPATRTLKLAAGGKVMAGKQEGKLSDLKAGDRVSVQLTADQSAALVVYPVKAEADGVKKPKPGEGDKPKPGEGVKPKKPGAGEE